MAGSSDNHATRGREKGLALARPVFRSQHPCLVQTTSPLGLVDRFHSLNPIDAPARRLNSFHSSGVTSRRLGLDGNRQPQAVLPAGG